jgi:hypothetical protein
VDLIKIPLIGVAHWLIRVSTKPGDCCFPKSRLSAMESIPSFSFTSCSSHKPNTHNSYPYFLILEIPWNIYQDQVIGSSTILNPEAPVTFIIAPTVFSLFFSPNPFFRRGRIERVEYGNRPKSTNIELLH